MDNFKRYIRTSVFFKDFLPSIKNKKHKLRGVSGKGKPIEVSKEEKKQIQAAFDQLAKAISKELK